jgi:hypothetical protein
MMTEGASEPPRFDPTTVNTTMHKYHDSMPKATTTEDKEGENKQRKDDSCFPAINHFYTRTRYPFYVIETTVEHFATKHTAHNPTTVTHCTGQTTTQLNLTEATLNRYTTMTLYKFFPHCSHPPYPEKVKQQLHHNIV